MEAPKNPVEHENGEQNSRQPFDLEEDVFTPPPIFPAPADVRPSSAPDPDFPTPSEGPEGDDPLQNAPAQSTFTQTRLASRFAPSPNPVLVGIFPSAGLRFELEPDRTATVGRDPRRCDLVLLNASVSQRHCQLVIDDDDCTLVELGSSNGTFVNGERVAQSRTLHQGDLITIGRFVFMFLWHRFTSASRLEVLYFRDLSNLMSRLYPTPPSVQNLLLASNLFNLPVDLSRGTIEQVWDRVMEQLRKLDVLASLDLLITCALRENSTNQELLKAREALLSWKASRQDTGVQEKINADVKNSAYVVREIIANHMGAEEHSRSVSLLLAEETEQEEQPQAAAASLPPFERPSFSSRMAPTPAELPFELRLEEDEPSPAGNETQAGAAHPVGATAVDPGPDTSGFFPPPLAAATAQPPERHEASRTEAGRMNDGKGNRLEGRGEANGAHTSEPPAPVPPSSRTDLMPPMLTPRTTVGRLDDDASGSKVPPPPWEVDKPAPPPRRGWVAAAVAAAAVVIVGLAVNGLRTPEAASSAPEGTTVAAATGDAGGEKPAATADAGKGADAVSAGDAGKGDKPGAEGSSQAAGSSTTPAGGKAPKPAGEAASSTKAAGPSLKPAFEVINFLGEDEKPKYTAAQMPAGAVWDEKTKQVTAASLKNCVWVGEQQRPFKSKGGKVFRFVRCDAGSGSLEGWVVQAGMKS